MCENVTANDPDFSRFLGAGAPAGDEDVICGKYPVFLVAFFVSSSLVICLVAQDRAFSVRSSILLDDAYWPLHVLMSVPNFSAK